MQDLSLWRRERNQAFINLDLVYARQQFPEASSDDVLLCALHKARYECTDIPARLRLESGDWLRERGFTRAQGGPILQAGVLP